MPEGDSVRLRVGVDVEQDVPPLVAAVVLRLALGARSGALDRAAIRRLVDQVVEEMAGAGHELPG